MLLRPGPLVADYLAGRRKRHFSPFQFLLLLLGLATLLSKQLHYYDAVGAYVQGLMRARHIPPLNLARVVTYFHGLGTYFNGWWLALLPLHALVTWAVYRRSRARLNFAESMLVQVVVGCAYQLWLLPALPTVLGLMGRFLGASTGYVQGTVAAVYFLLVGQRGLGLSWGGATWRAVLTSVLAGAINFGVNSAVFGWFVFGRH